MNVNIVITDNVGEYDLGDYEIPDEMPIASLLSDGPAKIIKVVCETSKGRFFHYQKAK